MNFFKVAPYIVSFILFMMVHDHLQEALQLQFAAAQLVVPNVFSFFDCLGCVLGPLLFVQLQKCSTTPHQEPSQPSQPSQPPPSPQHPFLHQLGLQREHLRRVFVPLALLTTAGVGFSNASLHLVNYPVKVTVKSFKLVPTMLVATQLLHKSYDKWKYISAGLLCLGLAQFLLSDQHVSKKPSSPLGVSFLMISCCIDAVTPVLQDKAMNHLKAPPMFVMAFTNAVAAAVMFVLLFGTGEMFRIVPYLIQRPNIVLLICMYGSSTFAGIFAYLSMVKEVGGVGTALVSTLRKVGTVVLSFVLQGRVFSWGYAMGGGMIVGSLLLQKVMKGKDGGRGGAGGGISMQTTTLKRAQVVVDDEEEAVVV